MPATPHFEKDRLYHETIAGEYNTVVVAPRALTNDWAFGKIGEVVRSGDSMLDLGCGTGHMSLRFGNRFRSVTAVDHSAGMLEQAKQSIDRAGLSNVKLLQSDVFDFLAACPSASFDLVAATGFLHHVRDEDLPLLLESIHRVLRPSGQFLLQEPILLPEQAVPEAITKRNASSVVMKIHYHAQSEAPDERPLDLERLLATLFRAHFEIEKSLRNWEIFPLSLPPTLLDRLAARYLNFRYGSAGNVLTLCARAE